MSEIKSNNETQFILDGAFYNFTVVQNYILEDERVTDNAIGLYMRIIKFQNSPTHKIYLSGLITDTNTRRKVTNAMNELIELGYIVREQLRENGKFKGYSYTVYMKPSKPCDISVSTGCTKTEYDKAEIGKVTTKKENGLKKKIAKKEISTTVAAKAAVVATEQELIISKDTNIKTLTAHQKKKVSSWEVSTLTKAIAIYNHLGGLYFKLLDKIYNDGAKDSLIKKPNTLESKNPTFTNTYSHNWDLDQLDELAQEYMERELRGGDNE